MSDSKVKGYLAVATIWVIILAALAVATKFFILPYFRGKLTDKTGSRSLYKNEIAIAADSFSGYAVLRSAQIKNDLKTQGIKLVIQDDQADYPARMQALRDRKIQMAVFTVDSFVAAGANLGQFPATIVMIIDETQGADAIISYKSAVASIDDLNNPNARIVATPSSPSEFLARTVIAHFNLPDLPEKWMEPADGAGDVYKKFVNADHGLPRAYVLWEPWVSKALEQPDAHLLLDSGKLKGYIVDILVAERKFLAEHPDHVRAVVEAYFRSLYYYEREGGGMEALVAADAKTGGESMSDEQAARLTQGIAWKNTLTNYAHFGLLPAAEAGGLQHIEDIITNITDVLIKTGAIASDPLAGKPSNIYYDNTLRDMKAANFHPGKKLDLIEDAGPGTAELDKIEGTAPLKALSEEEWDKLVPVGELRVQPISFARGTAGLNVQSERDLDGLAKKLAAWPRYYLLVVGHARAEGDAEANNRLAQDRAWAAADYLISQGVDKDRLSVKYAPPSGHGGAAQTVTFELEQPPY